MLLLRHFPAFFICLSLLLALGCQSDDEGAPASGRAIERFDFPNLNAVGTINDTAGLVQVIVPFGTDRRALAPTIEVSEGATVTPASGEPQDFTNFVVYTVTAASGARRVYTVQVQDGPSNDARLASVRFPEIFLMATLDTGTRTLTFEVPFGTDLSQMTVEIVPTTPGTTSEPASGSVLDLRQTQQLTLTAPDGTTTQTYTLSGTVLPQETGVRGVWLTNVDSQVLNSQAGIIEAVNVCKSLNFNTIFVVTYNKALTTYPSQVMQDLTGTRIDPTYAGRDPLRELIDAAHAQDIRVFAWFEYGFAAFNGSPGPILNARSGWGAIDRNGNQVVKNGFYWLNSLLPEVQQFMTDLVLEVVTNYPDIDGVQGDDRLPAMPSEGGYDAYTVAQYQAEHNGQSPPLDQYNQAWLQWRADRLNAYGQSLYNQVKALNPNCLVAMSPSPLDFGFREYLQDYTKWVTGGYCDLISPQLYRRDSQGLGVYRGLLEDQLNRVGASNVGIFYPGMLSFLGGYQPDETYLAEAIRANRRAGVMGEVQFFYNALLTRAEVFRAVYPGPAIYPDL